MNIPEQYRYIGGVKASRNNTKCYSIQKETRLDEKLSFLRKSLSLKLVYLLLGILKELKN